MMSDTETREPMTTAPLPALPLRSQRDMLAFWDALRGPRPMPGRADFTLLDIPSPLIRNTCLIEVRRPAPAARAARDTATGDTAAEPTLFVRFAGEAFYDAYGYEMSRKVLADLRGRPAETFWRDHWALFGGLTAPASGFLRPAGVSGRVAVQHWLRLPLSADGRKLDALLACDLFLSEREHAALTP